MNTNKLKSYAPKARLSFMEAITKRAALLGLYAQGIADITMDGESAIIEGRVFTRQQGQQRNQLVKRIEALGTNNGKFVLKDGFEQFINETAFTWFNRLTAIRYMEINGYLDHGYRVLSKGEGSKFGEGFEILASAADVPEDLGLNKSDIVDMLLDGNKEEELYRAVVLGQCHQLSKAMPLVFGKAGFEKLDEAIELLLPDNLTKTDSILKALINDIPEDNWKDSETGKGQIEVIGWLYQFYISERKDAVMGKVVKRKDIPAATQLFTPNWIVKYLVQNSLGRQWLATYPDSDLKEKMEYYISPAEQSENVIAQLKAITPTSIDPESIKVLDPACGSGHILVEVYEVLREIYLERGYRLREIPKLILTKNIYGLDIDDRAAQMASFAVLMKAREDDKRIFSRIADNDIQLNIYSLQSTENLDVKKIWLALDLENKQKVGAAADMFGDTENTDNIEMSPEHVKFLALLRLIQSAFINAKNLGSLIDIKEELKCMLIALNMRQLNLNGKFDDKNKLKAKLLKLNNPKSTNDAYTLVKELELLQIKIDAVHDEIALFKTLEHDLFKKVLHLKTALVNIHSKSDSIALSASHQLMPFIDQALVLLLKYDAVVANPPYMGGKGMNKELKDFAKKSYPNSKSDLFAMFMERAFNFLKDNGDNAQVNMQSWMFLSSFEKMRESLLDTKTFINMAHLGARAFGQISGEVVQTTAWVLNKKHFDGFKPSFLRLIEGNEDVKKQALLAKQNLFTATKQDDFKKIPGSPIAYWTSQEIFSCFDSSANTGSKFFSDGVTKTGNNDEYLRYFWEIAINNVLNSEKYRFATKGGNYCSYYGNNYWVVKWTPSIREHYKKDNVARITPDYLWNKSGVTWTDISSRMPSFRLFEESYIAETKGPVVFPIDDDQNNLLVLLAVLNSKFGCYIMRLLNPTVSTKINDILRTPFPNKGKEDIANVTKVLLDLAKKDWELNENTPNFKSPNIAGHSLKNEFKILSKSISEKKLQILQLHENLEKKILDSFDIKDSGFLDEIPATYSIAPYSVQIYTTLLISYSIGCMMGRYSLDREGLIYAHSGNKGFKELVAQGAYNTFPADDDGIIPLADEEWVFEDDATTRFREFVKTVWGEESLQENLDFVAESLCLDAIKPLSEKAGQKESAMATIRRYFSNQFYKDHLKTYKKRPIYWLFSSGKEKAFECLVYLHRYNESTLSRMRTEYVTPLMGKFESRKNILNDTKATASGAELRNMDKEIKSIEKKQAELIKFDEELKHLAEMKINLDLDDGVKVNYGKFGNLLSDVKNIHGKPPEKIK